MKKIKRPVLKIIDFSSSKDAPSSFFKGSIPQGINGRSWSNFGHLFNKNREGILTIRVEGEYPECMIDENTREIIVFSDKAKKKKEKKNEK